MHCPITDYPLSRLVQPEITALHPCEPSSSIPSCVRHNLMMVQTPPSSPLWSSSQGRALEWLEGRVIQHFAFAGTQHTASESCLWNLGEAPHSGSAWDKTNNKLFDVLHMLKDMVRGLCLFFQDEVNAPGLCATVSAGMGFPRQQLGDWGWAGSWERTHLG